VAKLVRHDKIRKSEEAATTSALPSFLSSSLREEAQCLLAFDTLLFFSMSSTSLSPMEALLGPKLLKNVSDPTGSSTASLLKDTQLVGLYFSAAWCPPCQKFSPLLKEFYNKTSRKDLEIVYISSDKSLDEFKAYYGSMPWLSVLTDGDAARLKSELARKFQLAGIPTLVILEAKTGLFVTNQGRQQVFDLGSACSKDVARTLVNKWIQQDKVPIEEAALAAQAPNILVQIAMAVLKNPMYMFGMLYFFKMFMRYIKGEAPAETDTPPLGREEHDEF
jgi:nucleoredoxin